MGMFSPGRLKSNPWPAALAVLLFMAVGMAGSLPGPVPQSRVLAAGPSECFNGEPAPRVSSMAAAWWWFWTAQGGIRRAAKESDYFISIHTGDRTLTLFQRGQAVKQYPVAVGKPSTPTPPGEWRIVDKSMNWGGGFGTRWLGINVPWGIYGIHGTNSPPSIGQNVSAGCVRMFNQDVEELFDTVPIGTRVHIHGPLPRVAARPAIEGGSGKFMLVLQTRLRQAGFDPGPIDGVFGPSTARAMEELHGFYGLEPKPSLNRDLQRLIRFPE